MIQENVQKQRSINQIIGLMQQSKLSDQGKVITLYDLFSDPLTTDLMCNADGKVYVDKLSLGMYHVGEVDGRIVRSIISNVAGFHDSICNEEHPVCEGEFPVDGSRFVCLRLFQFLALFCVKKLQKSLLLMITLNAEPLLLISVKLFLKRS